MNEESGPSWGMRGLRKWLSTAPETRDELLKLVQDSRRFLEPDTVAMLEGVLDLPATKIREVMTPRTAMISLQEDDQLLDILHVLVESAHSRFPVFSSDQPDNVVGILLAKDLLPFFDRTYLQSRYSRLNAPTAVCAGKCPFRSGHADDEKHPDPYCSGD